MEDISIGDSTIAGRYVVGELLGTGGFAKVFRGEQKTTGQEVAIKLLRLDDGPSAEPTPLQLERFRREARFCAELHHPNIVPLIDSGEASDGRVFVVFSLVPGRHLGSVLIREGALHPSEALHLMTQVMDALSCAHARGIVHRDLKPNNIMINPSGARRNALVLDFGIGTVVADRSPSNLERVTERAEYVGTPAYSAPEQLRGGPATLLSDVYAWGLIFLECLTGESPLGTNRPHEILYRQINPDPIRIPSALQGTELGHLLSKVTEKNVEKRQITAAEILAALQRIGAGGLPAREAILARSEAVPGASSWSEVTAPPSPLSSVWLVPLGRNPNFAGRDDLLRQIDDSLTESRLLAVVALHGLGGIGKTQLALEYAYRRAEQYRLVAWIRAEQPETMAADYSAIAAALQLLETPNQRQKIEAVRSWLEKNNRWLLIFDNAPSAAAIRDYLPRSHTGHIVVTSRHQSWRALGASLAVDVLDRRAAIDLILRRTGEIDVDKAAELCEELGRLPLALEEAAAYIEATGRSIGTYLDLLRAHREKLLFGQDRTADHRATLRTTWELSFREIEQKDPRASDLLQVSAFFAPEDIPFFLVRAGGKHLPHELEGKLADEVGLDSCMASLRQYSLVKTESDAYSMHRLVQLATRERLTEAERAHWSGLALEIVGAAYPSNTILGDQAQQSSRLLPHALAVLSHAEPHPGQAELASRIFRRTGIYLSARGLHERGRQQLERALELLESAEEPDPMQLAAALWELGMILYALGEAPEARRHVERSVRILEAEGGVAALALRRQAQVTLGWTLRTMGEFEQVLALTERWFEPEPPKEGPSPGILALMARTHWSLNHMPQARQCAAQAIALLDLLDQHLPLSSGTWYALAQVKLDLGEYDAAFEYANRGYSIGMRGYGRDHPLVCLNVCVRGAVLLRRGDLDAAEDCFKRALAGGERTCLHLHEDIAIAQSELGHVLRLLGDFDGARAHLLHAIENLPRLCGDRARVEGHGRINLAAVFLDCGDLEGARRECDAGLAAIEARYGQGHPLRLPGLNLLGWVLRASGDVHRAAERFAEAIAIAEAADLSLHPDYAESLEGLGVIRSAEGDTGTARQSFTRAFGLFQQTLGGSHTATRRVGRRLDEMLG